jgi:hypothetical protein
MTHSAEKDLGNLSKSVVPVLWEKIKALLMNQDQGKLKN